MKIDAKCLFAVEYPNYGEITLEGMTEDEVTWLINLLASMENNGIIFDYHIRTVEC